MSDVATSKLRRGRRQKGEMALNKSNGAVKSSKSRNAIKVMRSSLLRYPRELMKSIRPQNSSGAGSEWAAPDEFHAYPLATAWLGHATVLLRVGGKTILTDPVLSQRIGPSMGRMKVGLERLGLAPVSAEQLPPIDTIAISHAHFDHLDKHTLERLVNSNTTVITARSTRRLIPRGFGRIIELDWDQEIELDTMKFTAIRPRHWGARTAWDRHRGYNSYIIESDDHRVLYAGDTAETPAFDHLSEVDLAIFGIGAYDPWVAAHATPEQVWKMFNACGGRLLLPIHHSTFKLSDEHHAEPLERLIAAAGDEAVERIIRCAPGDVWWQAPPRQS